MMGETRELLERYLTLTHELQNALADESFSMDGFMLLIDKRELVIDMLKAGSGDDRDEDLVQEIRDLDLKLNASVVERMAFFQEEIAKIQQQRSQFETARKASRSYLGGGVKPGGYFIDRKK